MKKVIKSNLKEIVRAYGSSYEKLFELFGNSVKQLYSGKYNEKALANVFETLGVENIEEGIDYVVGLSDICPIPAEEEKAILLKPDAFKEKLSSNRVKVFTLETLLEKSVSDEDLSKNDACTLCYVLRCLPEEIFCNSEGIKGKHIPTEKDVFLLSEKFFDEVGESKEFFKELGLPAWYLRHDVKVSAELVELIEKAFNKVLEKEFILEEMTEIVEDEETEVESEKDEAIEVETEKAAETKEVEEAEVKTEVETEKTGRVSYKEAIRKWQLAHPNGTVKECSEALGRPDSTIRGNWDKALSSVAKYHFVGEDVHKWQLTHPDGTVKECINDLEMSDSTIRRYWDKELYKGEPLNRGKKSRKKEIEEWYSEHPQAGVNDCVEALNCSKSTAKKYLKEEQGKAAEVTVTVTDSLNSFSNTAEAVSTLTAAIEAINDVEMLSLIKDLITNKEEKIATQHKMIARAVSLQNNKF